MSRKNVKKSIRYRFLRDLIIILIFSTVVLSTVVGINEWLTLRQSLLTKGQSFASYIAKLSQDPLIMKDNIQLDNLTKEVNKDQDILYCVIEDSEGNFITSQFSSINYQVPRLKELLKRMSKKGDLPSIVAAINKEGAIAQVSLSIRTGDDTTGKVSIGLSEEHIRLQITRTVLFVMALNLLVALVIGFVFFSISRKMILNPITEAGSSEGDVPF